MLRGYRPGGRCRIPRHVRADCVRHRCRRTVRAGRRGQRSVFVGESGLGSRGDHGHLRVGRHLGCTPEPGGHARARASPRVQLEQGGPYIAAQFAGAFLASVLVFVTYREALDRFDGGVRQIGGALGTAGIWATYPQPFLSTFPGGLIDQIVGTALLVGVIFALSDARNFAPPQRLTPVLVGLLVTLIGATFGYNAGYAINPARDLAPRLFTALAGWGSGVFTAGNGWWWVPVVGPCIGGVLGGYVVRPADHEPSSARSAGHAAAWPHLRRHRPASGTVMSGFVLVRASFTVSVSSRRRW